jgi:DNA-binding MarR family transcriptional regulator
MDPIQLREALLGALQKLYELHAFKVLALFLQGEVQLLYILLQSGGREITPSCLSESLLVSRPRVTAILASLRGKGFVNMTPSKEDRRKMQVKLTPKGTAYIQERQREVIEYFDRLVQGLGQESIVSLNEIIERSVQIMDEKVDE